jgi:hypothetical protein
MWEQLIRLKGRKSHTQREGRTRLRGVEIQVVVLSSMATIGFMDYTI